MITTKRLFLIPWHASDADELYELAKDPEIGPLCGWEPHKTLEDSKQVLANVLSDKSCYAVKDMKTGHVIGSMSLNFEEISDLKDPSKQLHQAEIGYWIGRPYWGQGLAPEGVQALTSYAFEEHGVDQVLDILSIIRSLLQWLVSVALRRWALLQTLISTRVKKSSLVYRCSQKQTGNVFKNSGSSRHVVCCFKMLYKANSYNQRQNYMQ